jgi:hypothetical protein
MTFLQKISLPFIAACCMLASCTKSFTDINTDPNRPKTITPGVLLGQMQYRFVNTTIGSARNFGHELMQVTAPRASTSGGTHRYVITGSSNSGVWTSLYTLLADVQELYKVSEKLNEKNYQAIALIYKAWTYSILTDCFGDVPFSEAIQAADGKLQPSFDKQKDIYVQILKDLDSANKWLTTPKTLTYGGDLVYKANPGVATATTGITNWQKFSNTLRLRLLLRISKRDGEVNVNEQITKILASPATYPVFTSTGDDAILSYPGTNPFYNPYYNARTSDWRYDNCYTQFFIDKMNTDNDPRRPVWATTVGSGVYQGILSGYTSDVVYIVDANSSYSDALKTLPQLGVMMTYAELEFIKAELQLKGFTTGISVQAHYENGIAASITQWGAKMPTGYLAQTGVAYNAAATPDKQLEQIMLQKYYAYFFTDLQAWFEKRRTGYPVLPRGAGIPAANQFPSRCPYPTYLQSLNPVNLNNAIQALGGSDVSTIKGWWEK